MFLRPAHTYTDIFESATFSFRIQKFPRPHVSVFKSNLPLHTYPTRIWIHSSSQDSSENIGNRACVEVAILYLVLTVKNWAQSCYVSGLKKCPNITSTWFPIRRVFKIFHSGERIQKVTDSYAGFTRYVWTEAVSRKKKLQIQKYPDTCGRGLSRSDKKTHFIGV